MINKFEHTLFTYDLQMPIGVAFDRIRYDLCKIFSEFILRHKEHGITITPVRADSSFLSPIIKVEQKIVLHIFTEEELKEHESKLKETWANNQTHYKDAYNR